MSSENTLRTLKDLTEYSWVEDYQIVPKEQTHKATQTEIIEVKELKAEAVKWVKEFELDNEKGDITCLTWIKHFFNLTEEELK